MFLIFFNQNTAYEMRISNLSSDVCSPDLRLRVLETVQGGIIIGEELAARLGVAVGDVVAATSASGVTRSLRIVGLFKRGQAELAHSSGYVLLRDAQWLLVRPFIINRIGIHHEDHYTADEYTRNAVE